MMKRFRLDPENLQKIPASDLERLDRMTDADIDYSDIPEMDEDFFKNATGATFPPKGKKPHTP
jgi:hypothetical protein